MRMLTIDVPQISWSGKPWGFKLLSRIRFNNLYWSAGLSSSPTSSFAGNAKSLYCRKKLPGLNEFSIEKDSETLKVLLLYRKLTYCPEGGYCPSP